MERLEEIVRKLEAGETSVDDLAAAVKEGVELVTWCRRKLKTAQEEVESALTTLEAPAEESSSDKPPGTAKHRPSSAAEPDPFGLFVDAADNAEIDS